jgi:serine phosphatase RsbU (regulator of sigma subunit)
MHFIDEKRLQHLKVVYGIALAFIALTLLSSSFMMQYAIQRNGGDSRVINLSGRQRMLSQRLTKCVLALERLADGAEQTNRLQEVSESFASWKAAHLGLQHGDAKLGLPARQNSAEVTALFAEMEPFHAAMVQALDGLLAQVKEGRSGREVIHATAEVMLRNEARFLKLMDQITFQFDKEAKERISSMQSMERVILGVGLLVLLLEFLFVFRPSISQLAVMMTSLKQQANQLQETNGQLKISQTRTVESLHQLEVANGQVMESIQYARTIQQALLPSARQMNEAPWDHFVIWAPRDIIGGDLFWAGGREGEFIVALVDCTGHGVPGAIMTMLAGTTLHRVISTHGSRDPAQILAEMNRIIRHTLSREAANRLTDDGLDMAICHIIREQRVLTFAGARLSLFQVQGGEVLEVEGDPASIGYQSSDESYRFQNHRIPLADGQTFYLTTDGLLGQVGCDRQLPFGKSRLRRFLAEHYDQPIAEQRRLLADLMAQHRGAEAQRDDITVLGFRLKTALPGADLARAT